MDCRALIFVWLHGPKKSHKYAEKAQDSIHKRFLGERKRGISRFYARRHYLTRLHIKAKGWEVRRDRRQEEVQKTKAHRSPACRCSRKQYGAPTFETPTQHEDKEMTLKIRANWNHQISMFK